MQQKTIVITGSTSGIGAETAKALAKKGHRIILLARNEKKALLLRSEIIDGDAKAQVEIVHADLAKLKSIKTAAKKIHTFCEQVDVLINNAGGIFPKREVTTDGLEMSFSVNHLGHFLLFQELLPLLKNAKNSRVINVSSMAHFAAKVDWSDVQMTRKYSHFGMYANVKLFNILFTNGIASRYSAEGITAYSLHPGVVKTKFGHEFQGILRKMISLVSPFMISAAKGAETSVYLADTEEIEKFSGLYFKKKKPTKMSSAAQSRYYSDKLWELSEQLLVEIGSQK